MFMPTDAALFEAGKNTDVPSVRGFTDLVTHQPGLGWRIAGWAQCPADPRRRLTIAVLWHGGEMGRGTADRFREDLQSVTQSDGCHAFDILLRQPELATTSAAAFDVVVLPWRLPLPHSPQPAPDETAPALRCAVDIVERGRLAGWILDSRAPDRSLRVIVTVDGEIRQDVLANRLRTDLRDKGFGTGCYGFDILLTPPLSAASDHSVRLHCADTGTELPGSPFHFVATRHYNDAFRHHVEQTMAGLGTSALREDAIAFLSQQIDRLRHQQGTEDARRNATLAHRRIRMGDQPEGHSTPLRILFLDDRTPDPARDAASHALLSHMLAARDLGFDVSFMASVAAPSLSERKALAQDGITCWHAPLYPNIETLLQLQAGSFEVVYFHRLSNASRYLDLVRHYMPSARLISSVADLAHIRLARQAITEARPELDTLAAQERVREHMASWSSHAVVTHSSAEAAQLQQAVPTAHIHVVPWHVPVKPAPLPFQQRRDIAFVAHYGHAPNLDAAKWLVEEIFPLIRAEIEDIELLLAGSAMPDALYQLAQTDGVRVLGHVADLNGLFRGVRLTMAPLRFGAGIKGKVLESWAAGIPCIATPVAVEGLALPAELAACVTSGAQNLASRTCELYRNEPEAEKISAAGLAFVGAEFSSEKITAALAQVLSPEPA